MEKDFDRLCEDVDSILGWESPPGELSYNGSNPCPDDDDDVEAVNYVEQKAAEEPAQCSSQSQVSTGTDPRRREWETKAYKGSETGLKTVDPEAKVYFMLDDRHMDEDQEESLKDSCMLEEKPRGDDHFDYAYDHDRYEYEQQLDIVNRICKMIKENPQNENKIHLDPDSFSNDYFRSMLEGRFGLLDDTAETYNALFTSFKSEVLKEYQLQIDRANEILKYCNFTDKDKLVEVVASEMMPEEPAIFMTINDPRRKQGPNPFKTKMDPYKVPRVNPCKFIEQNLLKEKQTRRDGVHRKLDEGYMALRNRELNYAIVEPSMCDLKYIKYFNVYYPLVSKILGIILNYPLGITPRYLYAEFERLHGYKINYTGLGFSSFEELLERNDKIFRVIHGEFLTLTFPVWRDQLLPVDFIQRRVYHNILIMMKKLGHETVMPVEDVAKNLNSMLGIRFNVRAWGHESDDLYYRLLLHRWDPGHLEVVQTNVQGPSTSKTKFVLRFVKTKQPTPLELMLEEYEPEFPLKSAPKVKSVSIHPSTSVASEKKTSKTNDPPVKNTRDLIINEDSFVPLGTVIPSVGDYVIKGQSYMVRPELMVTPVHFFVSLYQNWDAREDFFEIMTKRYNEWMKDSSTAAKFSVTAEYAQLNSYVVFNFEDDWIRGRIVCKTGDLYKIVAVDAGLYERRVKLKNLKYLHKDFATYPEQTFICSFRQELIEKVYGDVAEEGFTDQTLNNFYDLLRLKIFYVVPRKKIQESDTWEVDSFMVDDPLRSDSKIVLSDIASSFVQMDFPDGETLPLITPDTDEEKVSASEFDSASEYSLCSGNESSASCTE